MQSTEKIGIIGLGIMGGIIADKFLKKGFTVFVFDIKNEVSLKYVKKGAFISKTPKDVAEKSDIIFEVTVSDLTSKKVWEGENGLLAGASSAKTLIVCSTLSAQWVDTLSKKCAKAGITFFDMAMTYDGYWVTLHCGGDKIKLKTIKPVLRIFAKKIIYFGRAGNGMRYKLLLNYLQALQLIGFGQALQIASAEKMDVHVVSKALTEKISWLVNSFYPEDFMEEAGKIYFPIEKITKDLRYTKQLAKSLPVSLLDTVLDQYQTAMKKGHAKKAGLISIFLNNGDSYKIISYYMKKLTR